VVPRHKHFCGLEASLRDVTVMHVHTRQNDWWRRDEARSGPDGWTSWLNHWLAEQWRFQRLVVECSCKAGVDLVYLIETTRAHDDVVSACIRIVYSVGQAYLKDKDYITPYWWYAMHYYVVVVLVAEHVPFYALRSVSLRIGW